MARDRVSVILPAHNAAATIESAIHSAASQSFSNLEIIVVDDASDDVTCQLVTEKMARDQRIKLFRLEKNSGPAVARNKAIENATGRYMAFLDADDQWLPKKLEKQITFMRDNCYDFTHSWYQPVSEDGTALGGAVTAPARVSYRDMLKSNRVGCLTAIYDTEQLGKIYMPLIRKRQDYGLWLDLLKRTPYAYCFPECLALYTVRGASLSSNKIEMLKYNWALFRSIEGFSLARSLYYLGWNVLRKLQK